MIEESGYFYSKINTFIYTLSMLKQLMGDFIFSYFKISYEYYFYG